MGLAGKHVEHRLWSLANDEFSKRCTLCPRLADILSVRVVVFGTDYELDGFLGVSDGVLHLLLRIRPKLLGLVQLLELASIIVPETVKCVLTACCSLPEALPIT